MAADAPAAARPRSVRRDIHGERSDGGPNGIPISFDSSALESIQALHEHYGDIAKLSTPASPAGSDVRVDGGRAGWADAWRRKRGAQPQKAPTRG
ncbi:hypothetical protein ACFPRL_16700 [Pseudoclavibacter helvolus]|uniref:Uncharacterized protein n=1 Tax=Pseudoclavibacter helvolus TaxID=255205 RepID=A0A7W4URM5_9MICO|nr:hypothetical protein [Pseudoclavibacter helvolus]